MMCTFSLLCSCRIQVFCRPGFSGYEASAAGAAGKAGPLNRGAAPPQALLRAAPLYSYSSSSIFGNAAPKQSLVQPETVIERLQKFPLALRTYLEFLVYEESIEAHTYSYHMCTPYDVSILYSNLVYLFAVQVYIILYNILIFA